MPGRNYINGSSYRYGMNAKEKDDEIVGSGNSYDYGARQYDPRLGRWWSVDPKAVKYTGWSPYNYVLNNPIHYVDKDGEDVYILTYTSGAPDFKDAALTRAGEIMSSKNFDPTKDHVYIIEVNDFGKLDEKINKVTADAHKNNYGKTVEFAVWSHAGLDGPIGEESASKNALYNEGDPYVTPNGEQSTRSRTSSQLSQKGWDDIDFNFDSENSTAAFYGCNSKTFAKTFLNLQEDVTRTAGQQASGYPSISKTERKYNILSDPSFPTYFVGAKGGLGWKVFFGATQPAIPMKVFNRDGTTGTSKPNIGPPKEDGTF
jgi:RHS repeat-associated protein